MEVAGNVWLGERERDKVAVFHPEVCDEVRTEQPGGGKYFAGAGRRHQNSPHRIFRVAPQRRGGESGGGDAGHGDIAKRQRLPGGDVPGHDHHARLLAGRSERAGRRGHEQGCGRYAAQENAAAMPGGAQNVKKVHTFLDCAPTRAVPRQRHQI